MYIIIEKPSKPLCIYLDSPVINEWIQSGSVLSPLCVVLLSVSFLHGASVCPSGPARVTLSVLGPSLSVSSSFLRSPPRARALSLLSLVAASALLFPPLPSSPPSRARGQSCPHRVRKAGLRPARPCHAHCFLIKSLSLSLSLSLPPSFLPSSFPSSPFLPLFSLRGCARCPARFVLVLRLDIYTYIPMYIYTCIHTYIHTYIHICTGAAGRGP